MIPKFADLPPIDVKHPQPTAPTARQRQRRRRRRVPAVQARRAAGPPVGHSRHAGPGTPHRRPREGGRHRQRQLLTRPTTSTWCMTRAQEDRQHRQRHSRCWTCDGPDEGRPAGDRLGRHLRRHPHGRAAVLSARAQGRPRPPALSEPDAAEHSATCSRRYKKVLVPELNTGQLRLLLRGKFLVDAVGLNKIQGKPFLVSEIEAEDRRDA